MERVCIADLESDGLLDSATQIWCGVFKDVQTNEVFTFSPLDGEDYIDRLLGFHDSCSVVIMHNGVGFDWPLLEKLYGYEYRGRKVDTLLISRLQNANRRAPPNCPNKRAPHSVEAWGYRVGKNKLEHDEWDKFSPEMLERCKADVEIQHLMFKELIVEAQGGEWKQAHSMTLKLFERLKMSEDYGWLVDQPHMHRCIHTLDRWIAMIDKAVTPHLPLRVVVEETKKDGEYNHVRKPFKKDGTYTSRIQQLILEGAYVNGAISGPFTRISFRRTDLDSNLETKEFLLREGWEPKEWNYDKDGRRTSAKLSKDDPFKGLATSLGRLIARRVQCRHRRSTVVGLGALVRADGRISSVVTGIATTGRAKHKNIVNIPGEKSFFGKQMRSIFIAKPGWVLVGTDSEGCQVRMLAARMGDERYKEAVVHGTADEGTDQHALTMRATGIGNRVDAKSFFFGVVFGAGDRKVSKIVGCSQGRAKELKAKLFGDLPALETLIRKLTAEWSDNAVQHFNSSWSRMEYSNGRVVGLDGRPIKIEHEHTILVFMLQSDEAIMMAAAYLRFHQMVEKKYRWGEDYGTLCWYHDEWTIECRPEIAEELGKIGEDAIEWAGQFFNIDCPHKGKSIIGENWYEIH